MEYTVETSTDNNNISYSYYYNYKSSNFKKYGYGYADYSSQQQEKNSYCGGNSSNSSNSSKSSCDDGVKSSWNGVKQISEIILKIFFGYYFIYLDFIANIIPLAVAASASAAMSTGCSSTTDPECLKCNIDGCMKCPVLLLIDSHKCTDSCPSGYLDQWSTNPNYMGRICIPSQNIGNTTYSALSGIIVGIILCLLFLIISIVLIKRKKRRKTTIKNILIGNGDDRNRHHHHHHHHVDHNEFIQQLNYLRPNAEYILAILNDTRRQIRKLHLSGEIQAANSYRPLVRDLAKLLILLNRPIELITTPPQDWSHIYGWAERALEQYRPQVDQLIDFFQNTTTTDSSTRMLTTTSSSTTNSPFDSLNKHSTFRSFISSITSNGGSGSSASVSNLKNSHQMQIFGSLISLHEFDEPISSDPFGSSFNTSLKNSTTNEYGGRNIDNHHDSGGGDISSLMMTNTELNTSSLWLEDEFFKLGLRPQDEITTEL